MICPFPCIFAMEVESQGQFHERQRKGNTLSTQGNVLSQFESGYKRGTLVPAYLDKRAECTS